MCPSLEKLQDAKLVGPEFFRNCYAWRIVGFIKRSNTVYVLLVPLEVDVAGLPKFDVEGRLIERADVRPPHAGAGGTRTRTAPPRVGRVEFHLKSIVYLYNPETYRCLSSAKQHLVSMPREDSKVEGAHHDAANQRQPATKARRTGPAAASARDPIAVDSDSHAADADDDDDDDDDDDVAASAGAGAGGGGASPYHHGYADGLREALKIWVTQDESVAAALASAWDAQNAKDLGGYVSIRAGMTGKGGAPFIPVKCQVPGAPVPTSASAADAVGASAPTASAAGAAAPPAAQGGGCALCSEKEKGFSPFPTCGLCTACCMRRTPATEAMCKSDRHAGAREYRAQEREGLGGFGLA